MTNHTVLADLDDVACAARNLRTFAATAADRKRERADLNRLVALVVIEEGADKHEVAAAAGIAYSTVNDVVRRARAAAADRGGRHARLAEVTVADETTLASGHYRNVSCAVCGTGRLYPQDMARTAASLHRGTGEWALDRPTD